MLEQVYRTSPAIGRLAHLAQSFFGMFRERKLKALPAWLKAARTTALAGFAAGRERDIDAVREALRLPWNRLAYATGSAGLATTVRGSSRRIKIMRFRPANIRLINRR